MSHSEHAFVSNPFWLKTGFDLFKKHAPFERDYLLPKLNDEWSAFRKVMASYNDISECILMKGQAHIEKAWQR